MLFVRGHSFKTCFYRKFCNRAFFVEIKLRNKKLLLSCSQNPNNENIENHLKALSKRWALYSSGYKILSVVSDFVEKWKTLSIALNTVNMILLSLASTLLSHPITFLIYLIFQTKYILFLVCSEFFSVHDKSKNLIFFTRTESF